MGKVIHFGRVKGKTSVSGSCSKSSSRFFPQLGQSRSVIAHAFPQLGQMSSIFGLNNVLSMIVAILWSVYDVGCLTAGVTRAGADGVPPSDEKKAEVWKMPVKRADSPASGARFVSPHMANADLCF